MTHFRARGVFGCSGGAAEDTCYICFPADALVEVLNKDAQVSTKRMDEVKQGDMVRTSEKGFSSVYAFGHRSSSIVGSFVRLKTSTSDVLELSEYHQVFVGEKQVPTYAKNVKVGDKVTVMPSWRLSAVTSKTTIIKNGVYNPLTDDGMSADTVTSSCVCSERIYLQSSRLRNCTSASRGGDLVLEV